MIYDFLEGDHHSLHELLQTVKQSLTRGEVGKAYEVLDLFWARLATHIRAENLCLFSAILNAPPELFGQNGVPSIEDVRSTIADLRMDHNFFMGQLILDMKLMRAHLADPDVSETTEFAAAFQDRIAEIDQRLESHNKVEEEQVYRWPSALLSKSEVALLDSEIRHQVRHLPPRFADRIDNYSKDPSFE